MATRLYITARPLGTHLVGPLQGDWSEGDSSRDVRGDVSRWTFLLADTKTAGGWVTAGNVITSAEFTKTASQPLVVFNGSRWVSKPLDGTQTISGTLTWTVRVRNSFSTLGTSGAGRMFAYITDGDTLDVKEILVDNVTNATAWNTTATWRSMVFNLDTHDGDAGDRIVVEFGAECSYGGTDDNSYLCAFGTCNQAGNVTLSDATNGATTTSLAAWAEFSGTVTFEADPAAPANDACADAIDIVSLPYDSGAIDATSSADTDKAVWWSFTAPETRRYIVSTLGGNTGLRIRVYEGGCGALSAIADITGSGFSDALPWEGRSQAFFIFDAVASTTYWISPRTLQQGSYQNAYQSMGQVNLQVAAFETDLETNDLFVDCQLIVAYRDGQLIKANQYVYQSTPTGNAIDYTLRPMDDANGGTDTSLRLYVGLFGNAGEIVIFDLATLNAGEDPIDSIADPLNFAGKSNNLSSIVFNATGEILLGWYGDNYAVIDELATVPTANLRLLDATHADNQTGAPFAEADEFAAAYQNGGTDFAELAADQDTIFYTSGGTLIKRYSIASGQLANFATLPAATGPRPGARTFRLLPPGDGTGGSLVAYGDKVYRLDAAGAVAQTYTPALTEVAQDLDKLELNEAADEFWVSDQFSAYIFHFEIDGTELDPIDTQLPVGQLSGFTVYEGYRAGSSPTPGTGGILVNKVTVGGDTQAFDFDAGGGLDPTTFSLADGESQSYPDLAVGDGYSVTEHPIAGWSSSVEVSNGTIDNIVVESGQTTVVTVTNNPTSFPSWLGSRVTRYPRRLIRSPHVSANGNYVRLKRLQIDMQPGMAQPADGVPRDVQLRVSHDGGNTWSLFRTANPGAIGAYLARVQWWQVGFGRDIIIELVDHLPNTIVQGWLDADDTGR